MRIDNLITRVALQTIITDFEPCSTHKHQNYEADTFTSKKKETQTTEIKWFKLIQANSTKKFS